jgi:hypothetical protein
MAISLAEIQKRKLEKSAKAITNESSLDSPVNSLNTTNKATFNPAQFIEKEKLLSRPWHADDGQITKVRTATARAALMRAEKVSLKIEQRQTVWQTKLEEPDQFDFQNPKKGLWQWLKRIVQNDNEIR